MEKKVNLKNLDSDVILPSTSAINVSYSDSNVQTALDKNNAEINSIKEFQQDLSNKVQTNTQNIQTNSQSIQQNTSDIENNKQNIQTNTNNIASLNEAVSKREMVGYNKGLTIAVTAANQTVDLQDNVSIYQLNITANPQTITLNLSGLTFPEEWYTAQFRCVFSSNFNINFTTSSGAPTWIANTQPTYDGKTHWVVLRVNRDKSAKLMSDAGTEG